MKSSASVPIFAITSLVLATTGSAQLGRFLPDSSFPTKTHRLDVQAMIAKAMNTTGFNGILGCCRDRFGHYWVTSRRDVSKTGTKHMLFEIFFDATTKTWKVNAYPQPAGVQTSAWGIRDLAYDGVLHIYGGAENAFTNSTVFAFNVVTKKWDSLQNWKAPAAVGTTRALAFDPNGNGGKGSMWTANWSSAVYEFDRTGKVLRTTSSLHPSTYGAAYDPVRKTVWFYGQRLTATNSTIRVAATEMSTATLKPTGNKLIGDLGIPGTVPGGIAGGLDFYVKNGNPVLLLLTQATSDTIYEIYGRFNYGTSSGGEIFMNGTYPLTGNASFKFNLRGATGSLALLMLGTKKVDIPLAIAGFRAGSRLHVAPPFILMSAAITSGTAVFPVPIPNDPSLKKASTFWQAVEINPSSASVLGLSKGGETVLY